MMEKSFYQGLEENEKSFADCNARHIMVQAGPGAGKSFAMLGRIERLIYTDKVIVPSKILVLAFNRMAAKSLEDDIRKLSSGDQVEVKTLHEHCLDLMQQVGGWEDARRFLGPKEIGFIRRDLLQEHPDFTQQFEQYGQWQETRFSTKPSPPCDSGFVEALESWLGYHHAALFGTLTSEVLAVLRSGAYESPYEMILVDEYQDLNEKEREIVRLLASGKELVVIGDEDQSIYAFRQSESGWTDSFRESYGSEYEEFTFHKGWRCPKRIAQGAKNVISHNIWANRPDLKPRDELRDGIVFRREWTSFSREIGGVTDLVCEEMQSGLMQNDICILVRTKRIGFAMQKALRQRVYDGKPLRARVYCSDSVLRSYVDLECLAFMSLLADRRDPLAWRILLCELSTGAHINYRVGLYNRLRDVSIRVGTPLHEILGRIANGTCTMKSTGTLMKRYAQVMARVAALADALDKGRGAFIEELFRDKSKRELFERIEEAAGQQEISGLSDTTEWLRTLCEYVRKNVNMPPDAKAENHIRIMTWHASKGLSARLVVILTAIDESERRKEVIEENRRLFYVAMTRCKGTDEEREYPGKLVISYPLHLTKEDVSKMGKGHAEGPTTPSRFIGEMGDVCASCESHGI